MRGDLQGLFDPRSVAVVGASRDPAKWGHIMARRALENCANRQVVLVNRGGGELLGEPLHGDLDAARRALGEALDLVVVCVPAAGFVDTVRDAIAAGARSIVGISAGFAEAGPDGAAAQAEAVRLADAAGVGLLGPNCLGVVDTGSGLQLAHEVLPPGRVTVLSQSGNLVLDLAGLLADRGLGIARFVSLGNQAQLNVVDLMRACIGHPETAAVAIYLEDVRDGRGFVDAARDLLAAGKPVVLLSPGRSAAATRSAASHTGALTSPSAVVDAACRAGGVRRVDTPTEMADTLEGVLDPRRMHGDRVAVVTDGGGHGAVAADVLDAAGLDLLPLDPATRAGLLDLLGSGAGVSNPVDLAGAGDTDPMNYARTVQHLLECQQVDGVLLTGYFGGYSADGGSLADAEVAAAHLMAEAVQASGKPLVVHTIHPEGDSASVLRSAGIPVHRHIHRAVATLSRMREFRVPDLPDTPPPAEPVRESTYQVAREVFAQAGLRFPATVIAHSRTEVEAALARTGFPVVLKALGSLHKSDAQGVLLGLPDRAAVMAAYDDLIRRLDPPAVSVEEMVVDEGVELIVGAVRDPRFGPVLMVGFGGVLTEVLADTAVALAPVGIELARELIGRLRAAPLLHGARGRAPVDLDALAAAVAAVSQVAAAHPELAEMEINPLLATADGVIALDARMIPH